MPESRLEELYACECLCKGVDARVFPFELFSVASAVLCVCV